MCGGCRARASASTGDLLAEDPWCAYQPRQDTLGKREAWLTWSPEAERRLEHIPPFVRQRVRVAVERHALADDQSEITPAVMTATLEALGAQGAKEVGEQSATPVSDRRIEIYDLPPIGDVSVALISETPTPSGMVEAVVVHFARGRVYAQLFVVGYGGKVTAKDVARLARLFDERILRQIP